MEDHRKKEIIAHAYTTVYSVATIYAATTMGDTTEEVSRVKQHKVIVGEVQHEVRERGSSWRRTPAPTFSGVDMPLHSPTHPCGGKTCS